MKIFLYRIFELNIAASTVFRLYAAAFSSHYAGWVPALHSSRVHAELAQGVKFIDQAGLWELVGVTPPDSVMDFVDSRPTPLGAAGPRVGRRREEGPAGRGAEGGGRGGSEGGSGGSRGDTGEPPSPLSR